MSFGRVCCVGSKKAFMESEWEDGRRERDLGDSSRSVHLSPTPHRYFYWWFQHGFPPWTLWCWREMAFAFSVRNGGWGAPSPCSLGMSKREGDRFTLGEPGRPFSIVGGRFLFYRPTMGLTWSTVLDKVDHITSRRLGPETFFFRTENETTECRRLFLSWKVQASPLDPTDGRECIGNDAFPSRPE